jgi:hypothetical protein
MLRRSTARLIIPQMHPVGLGSPSERGFLYKGTNVNKFAQIISKNNVQRSYGDFDTYLRISQPEQYFCWYWLLGLVLGANVMVIVYSAAWLDQPTFLGGNNQSLSGNELFQRNYEMTELLARHRTVYDQVCAEVGAVPEVLRAPKDSQNWKQ